MSFCFRTPSSEDQLSELNVKAVRCQNGGSKEESMPSDTPLEVIVTRLL